MRPASWSRRGTAKALCESIERLVADETLRDRLGRAAIDRAADFSPETLVPRVESAYELAIDRRRSKSSSSAAAAVMPARLSLKGKLVAGTLFLLALRLVLSLIRTGPVLVADEMGYLTNARLLSGGSPASSKSPPSTGGATRCCSRRSSI